MEAKQVVIALDVYRVEYDKSGSSDPHSAEAREYHELRKKALHEIFDEDPNVNVKDWERIDGVTAYEHVIIELIVKLSTWVTDHPQAVNTAVAVAGPLAYKAIENALTGLPVDYLKDGIRYVINQLWEWGRKWWLTEDTPSSSPPQQEVRWSI